MVASTEIQTDIDRILYNKAKGGILSNTLLEVTMKIHGYADEGKEIGEIVPDELAEITLVATPEELHRIARFLENCANGMEVRGKSWEHEHLSDKDKYFKDSPHFVVVNPEYGQ